MVSLFFTCSKTTLFIIIVVVIGKTTTVKKLSKLQAEEGFSNT